MRLPALALSLSLFTVMAFGEGDRGAISGSVWDANGAIIANATVQAKNTMSGALFKATSSAQGKYTLAELPAGDYEISVTVPALKPYERKNVTVQAAKTAGLEIRLEDTTQLSTLGEDRFAVAADLKKHSPPAGPTPRTLDGKPDLTGIWWPPRVIDPGKPEFLKWAEDVAKERADNLRKDSPQSRCMPSAVLRSTFPVYEMVQSRQFLVMIADDDSPGFHQIYLDGRGHPEDPNPAWYGHNVGRWDGDTLVVDRVGFTERVYLDQDNHPHTSKLHVIERYRRPDLGHLEIDITVEDPGTLAKPWTMKRVSDLAPTEEIYEFICPENNRDVEHLVGK